MPRDLQPFRYAILAAGGRDSKLEAAELREVIAACRDEFPMWEAEEFLKRLSAEVAASLSQRSLLSPSWADERANPGPIAFIPRSSALSFPSTNQ